VGLRRPPAAAEPGLAARELAVSLIVAVLGEGRALDDALTASASAKQPLADRDRAFARLIAATALRRAGELRAVLAGFLEKPLPQRARRLEAILLAGAAQLLFLGTPAHAAVDMSVAQCREAAETARFDKLANAILRRVATEGRDALARIDAVRENIPGWMFSRWEKAYGPDLARRIGQSSLVQAPLDITVKTDGAQWAARLGGQLLDTGSARLAPGGRIAGLDGFAEGEWWVQDAAAALPARLLGDVRGLDVADLCAAPGGKTAQLAAAGAAVTAVDCSAARLGRVRENLGRLGLDAALAEADAAAWAPGRTFAAVLLDAPCTATGTIRRHPDILHLRRSADVRQLGEIQERLLDNAARLTAPGGVLVYGACSLEPEEGPEQASRFLAAHPEFAREPVRAGEIGDHAEWITAAGDLRTLPCHLPADRPEMSGLDGFYAVRLRRAASPPRPAMTVGAMPVLF